MKHIKIFFLFFFISSSSLLAQSVNIPLNSDYYHLLERYEIKEGGNYKAYHNAVKPFTRKAAAHLLDSLQADSANLSKVDEFNINYLKNDSWEWSETDLSDSRKPFLKKIYRKQSDFYHVEHEDFDLHVNPVLYLGIGNDDKAPERPYINSRGIELRGMISKKLGFYTFLSENQMSTPLYVRQRALETGVVPNEGFWKDYGSKRTGYDFFNARGYISFDVIKNINVQFGHDKFFIGNGYRSMALSDYAPPYLFLKLNTKVWRINYTNIFAQMKADVFGNNGGLFGRQAFPNKYFAFHHLSVNVAKNFTIGLFESIVFAQRDSTRSAAFDLNYANPVIFYRSVEQHGGSPDNAILGMDFRWILFKRLSLYGQFILDELVVKEVVNQTGWWGNKFAVQGGFKYIDVLGIKNLDIQGEVNISRPFTYAHDDISTSYSHYRQPLAHPLGTNFQELIGIVRFQPFSRLHLTLKTIYAKKGDDSPTVNYGGNILRGYASGRADDYGYEVAGGVPNNIMYADASVSYMLKHNFWLELRHIYRTNDTDVANRVKTTNYTFAGLRWNIAPRQYEY